MLAAEACSPAFRQDRHLWSGRGASGAEQAAEKGRFGGRKRSEAFPQGLKATDSKRLIGPTKVVPLLQNRWFLAFFRNL
jgi:hypothetical protein